MKPWKNCTLESFDCLKNEKIYASDQKYHTQPPPPRLYSSGTLSVKRHLSLLQSDIHWNPLRQNESYLDTDYVNLSLISTSKKQKFTSIKEEINAMKLQEVSFQKSQKLLASRAGSSKQTIVHTAFTQPAIEIEWIAIECSE